MALLTGEVRELPAKTKTPDSSQWSDDGLLSGLEKQSCPELDDG